MELNSFKEQRANQSVSRAGDKPNFGNVLALPSAKEQDVRQQDYGGVEPGAQQQEHNWTVPLVVSCGVCCLTAEGSLAGAVVGSVDADILFAELWCQGRSLSHVQLFLPALWHKASQVISDVKSLTLRPCSCWLQILSQNCLTQRFVLKNCLYS